MLARIMAQRQAFRSVIPILAFSAIALTAAACGNKGPLRLPEQPGPAKQEPIPAPATPAATVDPLAPASPADSSK
jgi:predicted small lipoprotein YifL